MTFSKRSADLAPPTMADIARRSNVSKVTVSAVLSASAGNNTRVAEATRQRVLQAAAELNYVPNGIAKMFRRNRTNIIGLYLGDWLLNTHDLFLAEIVSGLQIGCHAHQKDLLIHSTFRGQSIGDITLELTSRRIDGLIIFAEEDDPLASLLASSALPVVAIADAVSTLPSVVADDRQGSQMIVEYLAAKGHERVLYRRAPTTQTSANRRYEAFVAAAAEHGLSFVEDQAHVQDFDFSMSVGEKILLSKIPSKRPTAIVCSNDRLAYAACEYCRDQGFRMPDDFAIVGFDGIVTQVRPAAILTTIRAPWAEVARTGLDLIVKRLAGESIPHETVLPVELVIGKTA